MAVVEPTLPIDDIQGDSLAGFRKDHVRLLFFQLRDDQVPAFKVWLAKFASQVATLGQVGGFNHLFKSMRALLGREPSELSVLWRNIGFTNTGIEKLIGSAELAKFVDRAFTVGAEALSGTLGDPNDGSPGSPSTWVVGSGANAPDGVIILAADSSAQLAHEVANLTTALSPFLGAPLHIEIGEVRAKLPGHEHFGFKDGISQPAPRGKTPDGRYITPRYLDPTDPLVDYLAAPGQALVWPGEFLLNGLKQKGANSDALQTVSVVDGPDWATNGSYLVFRRLSQDVGGFNAMVDQVLAAMLADGAFGGVTREQVGALLVGRFESGCPIMRSAVDDPQLALDSYASNNFDFSAATSALKLLVGAPVPQDTFPAAPADQNGQRCPFGAHIRKVNPRDDSTDFGSGVNNLQRRILRRGIPYGVDFDPAAPDDADRGLLFLCYQASIKDQFVTLTTDWVNGVDAPKSPCGFDPVISNKTNRQFLVKRPDGTVLTVPLPDALVVATGAAFAFVPPISALRGRLAA